MSHNFYIKFKMNRNEFFCSSCLLVASGASLWAVTSHWIPDYFFRSEFENVNDTCDKWDKNLSVNLCLVYGTIFSAKKKSSD